MHEEKGKMRRKRKKVKMEEVEWKTRAFKKNEKVTVNEAKEWINERKNNRIKEWKQWIKEIKHEWIKQHQR